MYGVLYEESTKLENGLEAIGKLQKIIKRGKKYHIIGQEEKRLMFIMTVLEKFHLDKECDFCVMYDENWIRTICREQKLLENHEIDGIIIADAYCVTGYEKNIYITDELIKNKIYEVPFDFFRKKKEEITLIDIAHIFIPFEENGRIGEIQFNLTDKCNLNCNLCSHFCPLVREEEIYDFDELKRDAKRIKELTNHVDTIGLWGGESFLYKELIDAIYYIREVYSDSRIELGTNGLLIPSMSIQLLMAIKKCRIKIVISAYPPTMKKFKEIEDILMNFDILHRITKVNTFFKRYDINGDYDVNTTFATCCSKICHTVLNGRFSSCYFPIAAPIFNRWNEDDIFETKDSIYNLYKEMSIKEFTKKIKGSIPACHYCGEMQHEEWGVCNKNTTKLDDWII